MTSRFSVRSRRTPCSPRSTGAPEAHAADWVKAIRSLEDTAVRERVIIDGLSDVRRYSWRNSALKLLEVVRGL